MAKQTTTSSLLGKIANKAKAAFNAHKSDETTFSGGGDLPAGIENGIARLVTCKFDTYKKGKMEGQIYFIASGIVLMPKKHEGIPVEGQRTQIMEPLCETPDKSRKTVEDHLAWILNELRKLGVDTNEIEFENLEAVCAAMQEGKPTFRFRTWKGEKATEGKFAGKEPLTNHQWGGAVDFDEEATDDELIDNTDDEPSDDAEPEAEEAEGEESGEVDYAEASLEDLVTWAVGEDEPSQTELQSRALNAGVSQEDIDGSESWEAVAEMIQAAEAEGEAEGEGEEDVTALGEAAQDGDQEAADRLTELATEAGLDPNDADTYPDWPTLAAALSSEEVEEASIPAVGEVWHYTPPKMKKAIECEVIAVFEDKETVNLKNLVDKKIIYKGIPFASLEAT